ncbi:sulfatase family protein [Seonamhaeicola maritimus]|uniref:Sulfatase-like hydrolase/transferase n=1 Tax=Seonamhaeicola maritimus TaxID=2591822 RepID=A0A5C7GK62_9FLAO|nr:sulfatase-like hydrolase/transferase [Seonamhaeicola maritimus]TXG38381.1 sulfatase-like hydrolase/transferase [Seonamhaeicola maritimus]
MNNKNILLVLLVVVFNSIMSGQEKPNFIVIVADDLGYNDVGFTGSKEIETPALDKLAKGGVIFTNGYVTHPYCGPSRAGLITGRYQARFGLEINLTNSYYDAYNGLPTTETTFAKRLKASGYRTGMIGKWHLGASYLFHPNNRGFDYFYGFLSGGHTYWPKNVTTTHPLYLENGTPHYSANEGGYWPLLRNNNAAEFDEYLTTALSRDAAKFVKESDDPFCLYLAYNAPHAPLEAPKELIDKYAHIKNKQRRVYAAMVDAMDQGIGMVVKALEESGKLDNTLIFFISDNGGIVDKTRKESEPRRKTKDWGDNTPYRGGKGSMFEGGHNVPFIAHWPKGITSGQTYELPISALDIAATLVDLGKGDTSGKPLEGVNLVPYVEGKNKGVPHEALFWRMDSGKKWAVRTPEAKYFLPRDETGLNGGFLVDMINDPYESTNIIDKNPKLRKKLAKLWNEWNAQNEPNKYLQAGNYQKARLKFYKELREKLDKEAKKEKPLVIE